MSSFFTSPTLYKRDFYSRAAFILTNEFCANKKDFVEMPKSGISSPDLQIEYRYSLYESNAFLKSRESDVCVKE